MKHILHDKILKVFEIVLDKVNKYGLFKMVTNRPKRLLFSNCKIYLYQHSIMDAGTKNCTWNRREIDSS